MYNYKDYICGVLLQTKMFYVDCIDVQHDKQRFYVNFYDYLTMLLDRGSRVSIIRRRTGVGVVSVHMGAIPETLVDDAKTAIFTTALHMCSSPTDNLLPNVIVKYTSVEGNGGITCDENTKKLFIEYPELFTLMYKMGGSGHLTLDTCAYDIVEEYNGTVADICSINVSLAQLICK